MKTQNTLRAVYVASDMLMSLVGAYVFAMLRYRIMLVHSVELPDFDVWITYPQVKNGILLFPLVNVVVAAVTGYYNNVYTKSRLDDLRQSLGTALVTTFTVFMVALINDPMSVRMDYYEMLLALWGCMSMPMFAGRLAINLWRRRKLRRTHAAEPVLVIGTDSEVQRMIRSLRPLRPKDLCYFDVVATSDGGITEAQLRSMIAEKGIRAVIITHLPGGLEETRAVIRRLFATGIDIYLRPDLMYLTTSRMRVAAVTTEPLVKITDANISESTANIKRLSDIVASALALLVLAPVYAAIAVVIKCTTHGPVMYSQERLGYRGRPFKIWKFCTMRPDAESSGPALSRTDDPRVTPIGRFLRKYRIDELPQFWNVLKGDMSIVGPRPERRHYFDQIVRRMPHARLIHTVRPGITSLGMVRYGYARNVDEMIERIAYDLIYVESVSLSIDLKILLNTVVTVVGGRGM